MRRYPSGCSRRRGACDLDEWGDGAGDSDHAVRPYLALTSRCPWQNALVTFDSDAALRLIVESLGLVERLGADPINVRNARMRDRTLVVEITARSTDPITVRAEICGVMGALSGLGIPEVVPVLHAETFGVRAYDAAGEELLWGVSSIEVAGFAGEGRAVEWLANSIFQDNTPTYRRSQADRIIGQIETGLRELLDHHGLQRIGAAYPARPHRSRVGCGSRPLAS